MTVNVFRRFLSVKITNLSHMAVVVAIHENPTATRKTIAENLGVTTATVTTATRYLSRRGLVEVTYRKHRENNYNLTLQGFNLISQK